MSNVENLVALREPQTLNLAWSEKHLAEELVSPFPLLPNRPARRDQLNDRVAEQAPLSQHEPPVAPTRLAEASEKEQDRQAASAVALLLQHPQQRLSRANRRFAEATRKES